MAALLSLLFLLLLLPPLPPAQPERPPPTCRLQWVQLGAPGGCRGGAAAACVGHCESSAFPSPPRSVPAAGGRSRVSLARCCTMARAAKIQVTLQCPGGSRRRLPTVSARACACDMCRLARF